jgi:hypothetical protein
MADEIIAVYRAEVEQYKKAVDSLVGKVDQLNKKQDESGKSADIMGAAFKKVGGVIAAAFTVDALVNFGKEALNLAAKAEGVERAFARIGSPQLLNGLRKATRGTVTDLQLMQNAVKASNFQIPLEQLANMFKFAQSRARETGESVDDLVDSIILGIGRKSPLILDNLGISAVRLREKFNGLSVESASVSDVARVFGEIATEELAKVGNQADTTADKIAQLEAAFVNLKTEAGKAFLEIANRLLPDERAFDTQVRGTNEYANAIRNAGNVIRDDYERTLRVVEGRADREKVLAEEAAVRETKLTELKSKLASMTSAQVIKDEQMREFLLQKAVDNAVGFDIINRNAAKERLSEFLQEKKERITQVGIIREQIRVYEGLGKVAKKTGEDTIDPVRSIELLEKQLKDLQDEFKKTEIGTKRYIELKGLIVAKQDEIKIALGEETDAMKKAREEREKLIKLEETLRKEGVDKDDTSEVDAKIFSEVQAEIDKYNRLKKEREDFNAYLSKKNKEEIRDELEKINEIEEANKDAQEEKEKQKQREREAFIEFGEMAISLINGIAQAQAAASQYELQILDEQLEQGQISREQYDEERRRIMRKQATDAKALGILEAVIATAVAVTKAYPNIPLAIIAGVLGAIQIGVIAAQPIPQFATGVIGLQGAGTETSDSIPAMLSRGESVMTAAETRKYRPILEGIRRGTLDEIIRENYVRPAIDAALLNGFADMGNSAALQDRFNDMNLLRAIDRHRESEVGELRQMNVLLGHLVRKPKRGYA